MPGATPEETRTRGDGCRRPSLPGLIQAMSSPIVVTSSRRTQPRDRMARLVLPQAREGRRDVRFLSARRLHSRMRCAAQASLVARHHGSDTQREALLPSSALRRSRAERPDLTRLRKVHDPFPFIAGPRERLSVLRRGGPRPNARRERTRGPSPATRHRASMRVMMRMIKSTIRESEISRRSAQCASQSGHENGKHVHCASRMQPSNRRFKVPASRSGRASCSSARHHPCPRCK